MAADLSDEKRNQITEMLQDGWEVVGYSVCLMAAGATSHHTLLRKGSDLVNAVVIMNGPEELGRDVYQFSPAGPIKKKGWFG